MLTELNKALTTKQGLACIKHDPLASYSFVLLHFASDFLREKNTVFYVSVHTSLDLLKINAGKLAIRIENSLQFISLKDVLTNSLDDDHDVIEILFKQLEEKITSIPSTSKSLVIFDDLSAFSTFGLSPARSLRCLRKIRKLLPKESLVLFATHNDDFVSYTNWLDFYMNVSLIGTGLGKGVTGKLELFQKRSPVDSIPSKSAFNYLLGERSVNMFLPGSAQASFI